jgi:hypothetical protein
MIAATAIQNDTRYTLIGISGGSNELRCELDLF